MSAIDGEGNDRTTNKATTDASQTIIEDQEGGENDDEAATGKKIAVTINTTTTGANGDTKGEVLSGEKAGNEVEPGAMDQDATCKSTAATAKADSLGERLVIYIRQPNA